MDIRDIIKSVRQRYPEYKWRKPKGKPEKDFEKLRAGKEVICPKCKTGIFRTGHDPKITHYFKCDKWGMMINFD